MRVIVGLMFILTVIGGFTYYVWSSEQKPKLAPIVAKDFQVASVVTVPALVQHYPVDTPPIRPESSLPALDDSDTNVANQLAHLFGRENLLT